MTDCARGCCQFRKHKTDCPVNDGSAGAWEPYRPYRIEVIAVCRAEGCTVRTHGHMHETKRGELEVWHVCNGCKPRDAKYGSLCETCHVRMQAWLGRAETPGSLSWAYDWIAPDLEPGQNAAPSGKISRGKPTPPAALALHVHVLRQDIAAYLSGWLGALCDRFDLHGPDWWAWRDEPHQIPKNHLEVRYAARYLATWLDKLEQVPEIVTDMYDEAQQLLRRVIALAPWEPKPRRLGREVVCPECERPALAIFEGQTSVTCMRCDAVWGRDKYDLWAEVIRSERVAS
jgi:hypothetical protein